MDLWDSKYQEWNSTRVGPKKDIAAGLTTDSGLATFLADYIKGNK